MDITGTKNLETEDGHLFKCGIANILEQNTKASNQSNYEYNESQVEKILFYLQKEVDKLKERFISAMHEKKPFSLTPCLEPEEYPTIYQPFPDGRAIRALAIDDCSFPAIEIELVNKDGSVEKVCLVEYNSERGEGKEVCIGTYSDGEDEPTHYYSYSEGKRTGGEDEDC